MNDFYGIATKENEDVSSLVNHSLARCGSKQEYKASKFNLLFLIVLYFLSYMLFALYAFCLIYFLSYILFVLYAFFPVAIVETFYNKHSKIHPSLFA